MLVTDFDPTRDYDKGQIHVRLIHSTVEEMGDPRCSQQVGYWCDEGHVEHMLKALAWALEQSREHREGRAEQAALERRLAEVRADVHREIAEQLKQRADQLHHSSPGCCKYAARVLEYEARRVAESVDEAVMPRGRMTAQRHIAPARPR